MQSLLSLLALVVVLHLGFALLALTQARHWRSVGAASPLPRRSVIVARVLGYALLTAALPLALWRDGPGFGSLLWGTLISVAATDVAFALAYWPGPMRWLARLLAGGRVQAKTLP